MPEQKRVLIVDDNTAFVDNLGEIFEEAGYTTLRAASCAEALTTAPKGFEVALVDLKLPDGDGTTLAARLRGAAPDSQIILLTGFASVESAAAAVRAGAWAYLMKPVTMPDLLQTLEQALRQVKVLQEKRELQRRAQVAEKLAAIGTLTAGLSHEIKNPLNAASLQLLVLDRRVRKLPEQTQTELRQPLMLVQGEIARLNALLEEFLDFARPRELDAATFDLAAVLTQVADLEAVEAERVGVRIERSFPSTLTTNGEERRLQQVVLNLVRNAIQATPTGGVVRIEGHDGDEVRVAVEDSGPGISDEHRKHIFEPFYTTKASGSGLGLPLVHSIVEQHGGSIAVESGTLGGARFVVHLPRRGT
jgi:signal transduction histidine kinase